MMLAGAIHDRHCEFTPAAGRPFWNESGSRIDTIASQGCSFLRSAAKQSSATGTASVARMERSAIRVFAGRDATPDFAALHPGYGSTTTALLRLYGSRRSRHKRW